MELIKELDITKMSIHNSKSGNFESALKNQFEMQSCKLNETESKPNITLKKMGQELDKAETKCFTLKSELNYMMGVCRKARTEINGNKGTSDISLESMISSSKNPNLKSPIESHRDNEITTTNKNLNYNIFQRIHMEQKTEENFDALHLSPRSARFSSRKSVDDDITETSASLKEEKQKRLLNVTITPKTQLDKEFPSAIMMMPVHNKTVEVGVRDYASRGNENSPFCFPEYMREHLQSMLNAEKSIEADLMSKMDKDYFCVMPSSAKRNIGDSELNLDVPGTAKAKRAEKSKRGSRMERSESSVCKMSDMTSKVRKRKGKLRSSISKSTVTSKDTNFFSRKEIKKRRHKGQGVIHQQSSPSKHLKKSNDVVEIFHNTTLKRSNSGVSSKHSKLNRPANNMMKRQHLADTANHKIQETSRSENINPESQSHNEENEQNHCLQTLNYQSNSEMAPESVREQDKSEKNSKDLHPLAQYKTQQCEHVIDRYDPAIIPSYEMSTLSSRLKRSDRSYFSRFNFRNIPFVVGTSVTPSHNLGLNIQQVLSVMKTRQPIANDITPLLIRKVSRGTKPVSSLLEKMNGRCERSILDVSSQTAGIFNSGENPHIKQDKKLPTLESRHVFCKEQGDHKIKQQSSSVINKNNMERNQQGISRISLKREDNIGDHKMRIPGSHNSKEIRDILINLHDQFEEMNTKYEKLQSEVERSNDESLSKELSALEKELNVKEEEINAVVGLYKEVRTLKQQMKMLHERNSLVCIATESVKETHKSPFPISIISGKSNAINPTQSFGTRKAWNATREPPTSMQLAALLRQIQTFHKQLQLVS